MDKEVVNSGPEILTLKFADSKVPVFKESKNKDYIKYGDDNAYPTYLTYLFNKSSKHNAIVTGKADYIFGGGFENGNFKVNRLDESLNDISKKAILDVELYGGFYFEIVWGKNRKIAEIYHVDYTTIRKGKKSGYWFKEDWTDKYNREDEVYINEFNHTNPVGNQIFSFNQYRPGVRFYPLPGYIGSNNYIEIDIEISKYYLSCIRNGMMPSKMIQFFSGEPTEDKKRDIEFRLQKKFAGAENAGKFFLIFNKTDASKSVEISDLSASDLDKHMEGLNKTSQEEIFSGHKVTSPMLFGIKTEGQLGGVTELKTAYEAFINTYAKPRAETYDKELGYILSYSPWTGTYKLDTIDPIGTQLDPKDFKDILPIDFVYKALSIPHELWGTPTVSSITGGTQPAFKTAEGEAATDQPPVNDAIRNLTTKQHQQVMRIIRQYSQGKMTAPAAKALLRTGYGLSETDINDLLGIMPIAALKMEEQEEAIIAMFDECGELKSDYEILKSKKVSFNSEAEAAEDEEIYINEAFKTYDVTNSEKEILNLIKKDPKVTPEVIAKATGQTKAYVESKIASLTKRGYIESTIEKVGIDEVVNRFIPKDADITMPPTTKKENVVVKILYSYEGPQDSRNRPFCAKMMQLNRLYSRKEIETISERLGYSVFDRRGGFWMHKDGVITPYCRHNWKSNITVKKN